ncbi:hypothetical protein T02_10087 [Trichinella nativa]|uniref:Uncharacterized protein n=1 Tax=Trichinella nativa TaxID=6335 RepID=A0A0V1KME0_9BILA|nr:hypothetical protein T02_10087 [Trichinella nativa]
MTITMKFRNVGQVQPQVCYYHNQMNCNIKCYIQFITKKRNLCQKPNFENHKNSKGYSLAFLKSRKFQVVEIMISIDQKKYNNHNKPGRTVYERVFPEILQKKLRDDVILAGAMGDGIKQVVLKIRNGIPFDEYLYKNYDLLPPSNVRVRNSICT